MQDNSSISTRNSLKALKFSYALTGPAGHGYSMHLMDKPAVCEPEHGKFVFLAPGTLFDKTVNKLFILLCRLAGLQIV